MYDKKNISCISNMIQQAPYDYNKIVIMFNEFKNSISFKVNTIELMSKIDFFKNFRRLSTYDVSEPDPEVSKDYYYDLYIASYLIRCFLLQYLTEYSM